VFGELLGKKFRHIDGKSNVFPDLGIDECEGYRTLPPPHTELSRFLDAVHGLIGQHRTAKERHGEDDAKCEDKRFFHKITPPFSNFASTIRQE
jgi:hypothetical protein